MQENVVGGGRRRRRRGAEETFLSCVIGQANVERAHGPDGGDDPGRRETAVEAKREDGSFDVVAGDESKGVGAHARTRARRAVGTLRDSPGRPGRIQRLTDATHILGNARDVVVRGG